MAVSYNLATYPSFDLGFTPGKMVDRGPFNPSTTRFDGTNDYLFSVINSMADGRKFIFSLWIYFHGLVGTNKTIYSSRTKDFWIYLNSLNQIAIQIRNAAGTNLIATQGSTVISIDTWYHIVWSGSLETLDFYHSLYLNDSLEIGGTPTQQDIDFTDVSYTVGSANAGSEKVNASMWGLYFNATQSQNMATASNRRKYSTSSGLPINLGSDGSNPTGSVPTVWLPNSFLTFNENEGDTAQIPDFTVNGALSLGQPNPRY